MIEVVNRLGLWHGFGRGIEEWRVERRSLHSVFHLFEIETTSREEEKNQVGDNVNIYEQIPVAHLGTIREGSGLSHQKALKHVPKTRNVSVELSNPNQVNK